MGKIGNINNHNKLASIFAKTSATYKFYWFISIVELLCIEGKTRISVWEIIVGMIANAWYPVHYFRLSFGKSDSLYEKIIDLQRATKIPIDAEKSHIKSMLLSQIDNSEIMAHLRVFSLNVPFRFLSPWITYTSDDDIRAKSNLFTDDCLYSIEGKGRDAAIVINPNWIDYLQNNCRMLLDFSYWNLSLFIQVRNPNVPNIPSKLVKPIGRNSLTKQRNYWKHYIEIKGSVECIFSHKQLYKGGFDVDHFIPWSFVSHDLIWNLLPIDTGINISKSNKLPSLDLFLPAYTRVHFDAIQLLHKENSHKATLEDYMIFGGSVNDLIHLSYEDFHNQYYRTMSPLIQIANNMGFEMWNTKGLI